MQTRKRLMVSILSLTLLFAAAPLQVFALSQPSPMGQTKAKKCERCSRGPDGKMVCKSVPCP